MFVFAAGGEASPEFPRPSLWFFFFFPVSYIKCTLFFTS